MLLGIDLGTSSIKAAVMAEDGSVEEIASASYPMKSPARGWAETDPADWWLATRQAVTSLAASHRQKVVAIGLSGQMHGVVLTDPDGEALRPAILWADGRADGELSRYRELPPGLRELLANPLAAGMAGPTLLWLRRHEFPTYDAARWALQPKDWLRLRLTSQARTEPTDASATLLYDLGRDTWATDVVRELGIRPNLLPDVVPSHAMAGRLTDVAAQELGLAPGLPVAAGAADAAASLLGHGVLDPGPVLLTIGTGAQLSSIRTQLHHDPTGRTNLYRTVENGKWYAMAAILNAGLALDWARTVFQIEWPVLYRSAEEVPPGAGGVTFVPHLVGERTPHRGSGADARWSGIALHHRREHLLKAVLEGVAFALREAMEQLEAAGIPVAQLRLAGGGAVDAAWRQLLADVLGKPLIATPSRVGSARGAALLAGV
ncbi:MAG TPA: xylulokinase, partial [Candidatus Dormibacteraeota bacterium]|nr:xylulokinase [Candidatus Dormibacteraeota bacterium]